MDINYIFVSTMNMVNVSKESFGPRKSPVTESEAKSSGGHVKIRHGLVLPPLTPNFCHFRKYF